MTPQHFRLAAWPNAVGRFCRAQLTATIAASPLSALIKAQAEGVGGLAQGHSHRRPTPVTIRILSPAATRGAASGSHIPPGGDCFVQDRQSSGLPLIGGSSPKPACPARKHDPLEAHAPASPPTTAPASNVAAPGRRHDCRSSDDRIWPLKVWGASRAIPHKRQREKNAPRAGHLGDMAGPNLT